MRQHSFHSLWLTLQRDKEIAWIGYSIHTVKTPLLYSHSNSYIRCFVSLCAFFIGIYSYLFDIDRCQITRISDKKLKEKKTIKTHNARRKTQLNNADRFLLSLVHSLTRSAIQCVKLPMDTFCCDTSSKLCKWLNKSPYLGELRVRMRSSRWCLWCHNQSKQVSEC